MFHFTKRLLLCGIALTALYAPAQAAILTWTVENATFSDGGTLSGSFNYDTVTQHLTTFSLTASGGTWAEDHTWTDVNSMPDYAVTNQVSFQPAPDEDPALILWHEGLDFSTPGTQSIVSPNPTEEYQLLHSPTFRQLTAGDVTTGTPEPGTILMGAAGAILLAITRRKKSGRSEI